MARSSPVERRLAKLRKEQGLRPSQPLPVFDSGVLRENQEIPDINYGAWSLIGQPTAPDYKDYHFL
jgi:hypothetical protein